MKEQDGLGRDYTAKMQACTPPGVGQMNKQLLEALKTRREEALREVTALGAVIDQFQHLYLSEEADTTLAQLVYSTLKHNRSVGCGHASPF